MTVSLPTPTVRGGVPDPPVPAAGCDCDRCPFYVDNPAAVEPICSGSNPSCSYCGCARAEDPTRGASRTGACTTCPIRCGSRPDIASWMADVGGTLTFDRLPLPGRLPTGLPAFVPQVDGSDIPVLDGPLQWPAYAVGLRRVLSPATGRLFPRWTPGGERVDRGAGPSPTAHEVLGLSAGQLAVLVGYGEDPLVEAYWTRRHVDRLAAALAGHRWDLVLTPNMSMYLNQPRTEHLINFRRNLILASELAAAGVTAVPCLYWARLEDLERYLDWIAEQQPSGPPAIAVNLQTFRTAVDWNELALPGLTWLAATIPADLPVVLVGASRADRINALAALFGPRLHLIAQNPHQYARHGARMTAAGRVDEHARVEDLFAANVRYYSSLLSPTAPAR